MKRFFAFLLNLSLQAKLLGGLLLMLTSLLLIGSTALYYFNSLENIIRNKSNQSMASVVRLNEIRLQMHMLGYNLHQAGVTHDKDARVELFNQLAAIQKKLDEEMLATVPLLHSVEDKKWLTQFHDIYEICQTTAKQFVATFQKVDTTESESFLQAFAFNRNFKSADKLLAEMLKQKKHDDALLLKHAHNQMEAAILLTICLLLITVLLVASLGYMMVMSIRRPTEQIRFAVEQLADGKLDVKVPCVEYPNEFGELARSIEVLQSEAKQMAAQRWLKTHQATIQAQLQLANNFTDLARRFLSTLSPLINIGQAVFYIFDERRQHLRMLGGYAYKERKHFTPFFSLGQGLVGQCALEREPIIIHEPPEDYLYIGSSLGAAKATTVAVYPVVNKDRLLAVIEFAAFTAFNKEEQELLASIMPVLAMSVEILERNVKTQQLLEETQRQAEAGLFEGDK